jgi:hypothetical protein
MQLVPFLICVPICTGCLTLDVLAYFLQEMFTFYNVLLQMVLHIWRLLISMCLCFKKMSASFAYKVLKILEEILKIRLLLHIVSSLSCRL